MNRQHGFLADQAYYGSRSGRGDFWFLAQSPGLDQDQLKSIENYINLAGSVLSDSKPLPIYTYFPLDQTSTKRVFCKTYFPEKQGPRGNNYLVHLLVLDIDAVKSLNGNIFCLESLFRYQEISGDLQKIHLTFDHPDELLEPGKGMALSGSFSLDLLIQALSRHPKQTVAFEENGQVANQAVKDLFAVLPPEDCFNLFFCTRYSLTRRVNLSFCFYSPVDRGLVHKALGKFSVFVTDGAELKISELFVETWLKYWAGHGCNFYGISLIKSPKDAIQCLKDVKYLTSAFEKADRVHDLEKLRPSELCFNVVVNDHNEVISPAVKSFCYHEWFGHRVDESIVLEGEAGGAIASHIVKFKSRSSYLDYSLILKLYRSSKELKDKVAVFFVFIDIRRVDLIFGGDQPGLFSSVDDVQRMMVELLPLNRYLVLYMLELWIENYIKEFLNISGEDRVRKLLDFFFGLIVEDESGYDQRAIKQVNQSIIFAICSVKKNVVARETLLMLLITEYRQKRPQTFDMSVLLQICLLEDFFYCLNPDELKEAASFLNENSSSFYSIFAKFEFGETSVKFLRELIADVSSCLCREKKSKLNGQLSKKQKTYVQRILNRAAYSIQKDGHYGVGLLHSFYEATWASIVRFKLEAESNQEDEAFMVFVKKHVSTVFAKYPGYASNAAWFVLQKLGIKTLTYKRTVNDDRERFLEEELPHVLICRDAFTRFHHSVHFIPGPSARTPMYTYADVKERHR
ncbi:hypothetical protein [Acanthopleuribacter pedis]|uniref:Uncharacterized protein n=1 Tax=Acanthopleuribacter pedis TaxID=442870 RepID=A0A8J7Q8M7_9BACT|nr:hypothetical protein [Acanthopleuribacter pedis]MBO1319737.1 hypothetical protein [Acanthopleuribacter pedis]